MKRLDAQYRFLVEADRLKNIRRKSRPYSDSERYENAAEHSWHIALMALVLEEHAHEALDMLKVIRMLIVHDLVEIDTGDKLVYHKTEDDEKAEEAAADRIFGMLPEDQKQAFTDLWNEFNRRETPEARFAAALDRFQAATQNMAHGCRDWTDYDVPHQSVLEVNRVIQEGSDPLWRFVKAGIERCRQEGKID